MTNLDLMKHLQRLNGDKCADMFMARVDWMEDVSEDKMTEINEWSERGKKIDRSIMVATIAKYAIAGMIAGGVLSALYLGYTSAVLPCGPC